MMHYRWQVIVCALAMAFAVYGCNDAPIRTATSAASPTATATQTRLPTQTPVPSIATATAQPSAPSTATRVNGAPLNLGVAAGNTYGGYAAALDQKRGLLYVLGRKDGASENQGSVAIVDLAQAQVRATIALSITAEYQGSLALSADGARLFILGTPDRPGSSLIVVDTGAGQARAGSVLSTQANVTAIALDAANDQLYVLEGNTLRQIDARTMREGPAVSIRDTPSLPLPQLIVNPVARHVYVVRPDSTASVYSTQDMRLVSEITINGRVKQIKAHPTRAETYAIIETVISGVFTDMVVVLRDGTIAATWNSDPAWAMGSMIIDDASGQILVLEDAKDVQNRGSRVRALDPATGKTMTTVALPDLGLTYTRSPQIYQNKLYQIGDLVSVVSLSTGEIGRPIPLGIDLVAAALDDASDRLYVLDSIGSMHVVNSATYTEIAVWERVVDPGSTTLYQTSLTAFAGKLYLPAEVSGETRVLDAATGKQVAMIAKAGKVTVDTRHNRLLLVNQGIYTVDTATLQITGAISETLRYDLKMIGPSAVGVSYDPGLDMIFATMSNNSPGSSSNSWLQIYDGATLARISSTINTDQQFLAALVAETSGGRVWVAGTYPGQTLTAFTKNGQIQTRLKGLGNRMFLDTQRQRLYIADWDGLVTLDTQTSTVIAYRPTESYVSGLMLYDQKRHRIYANGSGSARLSVVDPDEPVVTTHSILSTLPAGRVVAVHSDASGDAIVDISRQDTGRHAVLRSSASGWVSIRDGLPPFMQPRLVTAPDMPGVIFAFADSYYSSGFYRSTDSGQTWQVCGRGLGDFRISSLVLSPTFSKDGAGVLVTVDRAVYQTRDHGQSWTMLPDVSAWDAGLFTGAGGALQIILARPHPTVETQTEIYTGTSERMTKRVVDAGVPAYRITGLAVSPDGKTVLRFVPGGSLGKQTDIFILSGDGGETWQIVGPTTTSNSSRHIVVFSPTFASDHTVYALLIPYFSKPEDKSTLLRSLDGGRHWEWAANADPLISALAILPGGQLLTGSDKGDVARVIPSSLRWQPAPYATPTAVPPTPLPPAPTPQARLTPFPPPPATRTPVLYQPDPVFQAVYALGPEIRGMVGLATVPQARDVWVAVQQFEAGRMLWREDTATIYVLPDGKEWTSSRDTWAEGQPETDPTITPPGGKLQPKRGFGKVWRSVPAVRQQLGWAVQDETGYAAKIQNFQLGAMMLIDGKTYLIGQLNDKNAWIVR